MSLCLSISLFVFVLFLETATSAPFTSCRDTGEAYFVSDDTQCDRYHQCQDGEALAYFMCEDGLVYEPLSSTCALPFVVSCEGRTSLQTPKPMGRCPRLNGRWAVDDTCDRFINCIGGQESEVICQNHLVFDTRTGDCAHPDVARREGCTAEERFGFSCPTGILGQRLYAADQDCRAFFVCSVTTGYHPRLGGCPSGTVFNEKKQTCDDPKNVEKCQNYYATTGGDEF